MSAEPNTPPGWTAEAWQEQMYVEVKIAYRLSGIGLIAIDDGTPYDAEETARVDAEYDNWLARHDAKIKADALREAAGQFRGSGEVRDELESYLHRVADRIQGEA